ncbi:hypothetical protein [Anaeromyxobacter diazotrophicus]|uniref:Uncharacterized protein n=1 Tax=Anaeromyxobacter diazotrophicus TaxID=2590199 RepID=A0A7I9VK95_9BACT|nr:hypothetical protein [Anaeromyxobacter diazotrophicus]GEJ56822.1 hypothetical protein AMYX_15630 [Anaeromyxobacter diazotrophicus]
MTHVRAAAALALLALASGCAHAPAPATPAGGPVAPAPRGDAPAAPEPPSRAERLALLRSQVDALLTSQARALWAAWTKGGTPELDASAGSCSALFAPDALGFLAEARAAAEGDERRALTLLRAYVLGEQLARALPANLPAPAPVVTWDGRAYPSSRVRSLLAAEPDPARRAALEHAWAAAERREAPRAEARWKALADAAKSLGYGSLLALAADLRGAPAEALAALAEDVLTTTDGTYRTLLATLGRVEMGKSLAELRGRDLPRLFRAGEDGRTFPAARLGPDAAAPFASAGLAAEGPPALIVDAEARAGKDPRALVLPVEVPADVRVSYAPAAGASELRALLHELGAATFYARVRSPVLEFRRLGSVTAEAWGYLFEALHGDPAWLAERTGVAAGHLAPVVRAAAARRLHLARVLAARLLGELARQRDPAGAREAGRAVLERAMARPVEADELDLFLAERDPLLESADALRAVLLAAQAERHLAARAGAAWWRSAEAGRVLAAAFADGSRLEPSELSRALGAEALDGAALAAVSAERAAAVR